MPDEQPAEVLGVEETDLIISTSSFSSSSMPINATCIFFNASSDLSCVNTNLTGEADVVYPYKVRFTGRFVQPHHLAGATLQNYAEILAAAISISFPLPRSQLKVDEDCRWSS